MSLDPTTFPARVLMTLTSVLFTAVLGLGSIVWWNLSGSLESLRETQSRLWTRQGELQREHEQDYRKQADAIAICRQDIAVLSQGVKSLNDQSGHLANLANELIELRREGRGR